jgi:Raf kinase inhibitor-like YbhB/YbcL family protein
MKRFCLSPLLVTILIAALTAGCGAASTTEAAPLPTTTNFPTFPPPTETAIPKTAISRPEATATTAPTAAGPFTLFSPAFKDGEQMADRYVFNIPGQCSGENYSPALMWTGTPSGAQSFAITVIDPDGGNWLHWLLFNIPADTTSLTEAVGGPDTGIKGENDFGALGYGGPCPPGNTHRYIFSLYALDTTLDLQEGARLKDLKNAMAGHILVETQLTGLRTR